MAVQGICGREYLLNGLSKSECTFADFLGVIRLLSPQDVPSMFWRTEGAEGFDGCTYTLQGPTSACSVKTATQTFGKQTFCSFTKGWSRFCTANALKLGDTIQFTKVGEAEFKVMLV
jgi:hypothetical protein